MGSFFIERKLKKGVEAHEGTPGKAGNKKDKKQKRGGKIIENALKMLRRG
jgi:hypothetical protein